jgi:DNA mismatch endonuclease, patch repair protein
MDKVSKEKRSEIMSRIHSKGTKVEDIVFKELRKRKVYFQKHYKKAAGNPDIALPRKKKAVFIDGDFWHGYQIEKLRKRLPEGYWQKKIERNVVRDKKTRKALREKGWEVLSVWEHEVYKNFDSTIKYLENFLVE